MDYDFQSFEKKWQKAWTENKVYQVTEDPGKPKCYVLDMFPYPSGSGLHVGHPLGYIASDIYSRYQRLKGFNVLHPMGFDAFGLPAEQYAVETGQHPRTTTEQNVARFKEQLQRMGFCFDWSREVNTADPQYYKWTQWIFMQLYQSWYDLALDKARPISELIDHFDRHGSDGLNAATDFEGPISAEDWTGSSRAEKERILMNFRLAYQAYSTVNWCEELGTVLANDEVKDGLSERGGFPVVKKQMRQWFLRITAYAERLLNDLDELNWSESMKDMQRNWIGRSEGAVLFFPVKNSDKKIEVFTTRPDTVYGATFMVLAPEHDWVDELTSPDREKEVADYKSYVESRSERERQAEVRKVTGAFTGSYARNPLTGKDMPIWISEYVLAGYGTGAIMAVPSRDERDHAFAQEFGLEIIEVIDQSEFPHAGREEKVGRMINSGDLDGLDVKEAIQQILSRITKENIGEARVQYKLRDAGFSRQRYWGEPFPVVYQEDVPQLLPVSELPLRLPQVETYKPTGTGESPLAAVRDWVETDMGIRETDTMPGYAGSSWYFLRYMDPHNPNEFVGKDKEAYWQDVDFYIGGAEHAVGHLMYSRFWQKFFYDRGWVGKVEPFRKMVNQGMIQGVSEKLHLRKEKGGLIPVKREGRYVNEDIGLEEGVNVFLCREVAEETAQETVEIYADLRFIRDYGLSTPSFLDAESLDGFRAWRPVYKNAVFVCSGGYFRCGQYHDFSNGGSDRFLHPH